MTHPQNRRYPGFLLLIGLVCFTGCNKEKQPRSLEGHIASEDEVSLTQRAQLHIESDIATAQLMERYAAANPGRHDTLFTTRDGVDRQFATLKEFRADIKHRLDSLLATGTIHLGDTTYRPEKTSPLHTFSSTPTK